MTNEEAITQARELMEEMREFREEIRAFLSKDREFAEATARRQYCRVMALAASWSDNEGEMAVQLAEEYEWLAESFQELTHGA